MKVLLNHKAKMYDITGYHIRIDKPHSCAYVHMVVAEKKVGPGENELAFDTVWLFGGTYNECLEMFDALVESEISHRRIYIISSDGTPKPEPLAPENDPDFDF